MLIQNQNNENRCFIFTMIIFIIIINLIFFIGGIIIISQFVENGDQCKYLYMYCIFSCIFSILFFVMSIYIFIAYHYDTTDTRKKNITQVFLSYFITNTIFTIIGWCIYSFTDSFCKYNSNLLWNLLLANNVMFTAISISNFLTLCHLFII
jgi:uncharacterized BrkB/YihY/UPF0761 family membrane protein